MRTNQKKLIFGLLVLLCMLSVQMVTPCLLLAANNMSLTASPASVTADGFTPSLITATVDNSGTPDPGVGLKFTTSLGRFSSGGNTIDTFSNGTGISVVALTSPNVGIATVTCETTTGPFISRTVYVNFSAPIPSPTPAPTPVLTSFVLSADPAAVPAYDPSLTVATFQFSSISAQLYNQNGTPLALPDVSVVFTTTPAGLAHFSNKLTTITVSTDGSGKATALLYSPVVGTAAVNAIINNGFSTITTNPVFVNFIGPGTTAFIVLAANPISDIKADNLSPSTITATLYDIYGRTVNSGVKVTFTTTFGKFTNNDVSIDAYTNSLGVATVSLSSGSIGIAQVSASSNGVTRYVNISFIGSGPTADILLTANPASNPADNQSVSTITATLFDGFGKAETSGIKVTFKTSLGKFTNNDVSIDAYTNSLGVATVSLSSGSIGIAQVSASSNGVIRYINVSFTGVGPPAFISLSAAPNWIPADGYTFTAITATILDSAGKPVAKGTAVKFTTTLGVFGNGQSNYLAATPDDTGTLTVHLRATSSVSTGFAVITVTSGNATQSFTVGIVQLEYGTGLNNDMAHADKICFNNVYLGQLFSPYEEDWYTFTVTTPSRIGINFITTAIPKIAGDCKTSTTVGTYRVDIRDSDNKILTSNPNVDCSLDNGIWETAVAPGTYYIVVRCPRLPDNSHYLSDKYYLAVFDNFYIPCGDRNNQVNSASLSLEDSVYNLHVPISGPTPPYLWADLQYDPISATNLIRVTNFGFIANLNDYRSCNLSTLSPVGGNYVLHIPVLIFEGVSYRLDLTYVPTSDGQIWFMLSGVWPN